MVWYAQRESTSILTLKVGISLTVAVKRTQSVFHFLRNNQRMIHTHFLLNLSEHLGEHPYHQQSITVINRLERHTKQVKDRMRDQCLVPSKKKIRNNNWEGWNGCDLWPLL